MAEKLVEVSRNEWKDNYGKTSNKESYTNAVIVLESKGPDGEELTGIRVYFNNTKCQYFLVKEKSNG